MNLAYKYDIVDMDMDDCYSFYQDDEDMDVEVKPACSIKLDDIMGSDHYVWVTKNPNFGFDIEIQSDDSAYEVFKETGVHPYSLEGLAYFCQSFLRSYSHAIGKEVK